MNRRPRIVATYDVEPITDERLDGTSTITTPEVRIHVEVDVGDEYAARAILEAAYRDILRQLDVLNPRSAVIVAGPEGAQDA